MLQRKVCLLGSFGVGKTSLVRRFVHSLFSARYLTTVGVKVDKKTVTIDERDVHLILWDLAGEDDLAPLDTGHLRGMHGCFIVIDRTRAETARAAQLILERVRRDYPEAVILILLNKLDLTAQAEVTVDSLSNAARGGAPVIETSALNGAGVEEAFQQMAKETCRGLPAS